MKQISHSVSKQRGFAMIELIVIAIVVVIIGGVVAWRVYDTQQNKEQRAGQDTFISGPLLEVDRKRVEEVRQQGTTSSQAPNGQSPSGGNGTAQSNGGQTANGSSSATSNTSNGGASTPASGQAAPASGSSNGGTQTNSKITRPTAAWCAQQNDTFTNLWTTDNSSHTYTIWENGGWVTKTETGTAARNFDTMQIVAVIPYLTKPAWAGCNSQRPGYITVYYNPPGSPYTYNWLVAYEHLSLTQP